MINETLTNIKNKLLMLPSGVIEEATKSLNDITQEELMVMQNKQSILRASGKIPLETAQFIYDNIGEGCSVNNWRNLPLETKILISQLFLGMQNM